MRDVDFRLMTQPTSRPTDAGPRPGPGGSTNTGFTAGALRSWAVKAVAVLGAFMVTLLTAGPAHAQSAVDIADELDQTGRYLELPSDANLDAAIDEANSDGVAFAWLDQAGAGEAERLSEELLLELDSRGSRYRTVLVLMEDNFGAWSSAGDSRTDAALDASLRSFGDGAVADGVTIFTDTLRGELVGSGSTPTTQAPSGSGSGGGLGLGGILLPAALLGGGFMLFRGWSNKRKETKQVAADLTADRAEIKEQLRNNADRVIELGDRVVLSDNRELQDLYEKASVTYQDVSNRIDGASTVAEIDELDDRIDEAEWQLKSIEAQLDGKPIPPSPVEVAAAEQAAAQEEAEERARKRSRPALGSDESVVRGTNRRSDGYARSGAPGGYYRRGGMGGMGGGLGGMLGSIILGGMRGGRYPQTRRTQRRTGFPGGFPSGGGGLGGGVLRPGGRSRSGGGRSTGGGRRGSGGGRNF